MSDTPTPEQVIAKELRRSGLAIDLAEADAPGYVAALAAAGFRVYPEPGEDTHPTPSHSATMRELEQTRAERDAAVARAEAAEASVGILAQGELDMTVRAVTAEAEAQRLREGIETHQQAVIDSRWEWVAVSNLTLWALIEETTDDLL